MYKLQRAGAFALIFSARCLRHALITLADMREGTERARLAEDDGLQALRDEMEAMHTSLRELKASLEPAFDGGDRLLQ